MHVRKNDLCNLWPAKMLPLFSTMFVVATVAHLSYVWALVSITFDSSKNCAIFSQIK